MAMFFEPRPAGEEAPARRWPPERPEWAGPPGLETGVLLGIGRVVARSEHVVVFLPAIRVFSTGCMLEIEIVTRQAGLPEDEWWDLRLSVHRGYRGFQGPRLPDKLLRLGVRFPDGGKATTLDRGRDGRDGRDDEPPTGPVLSWWPGSSGTRDGGELGLTISAGGCGRSRPRPASNSRWNGRSAQSRRPSPNSMAPPSPPRPVPATTGRPVSRAACR
jgi:hypothetical protein